MCTVGCFVLFCFSLLVKGEIKSSAEFKAFTARIVARLSVFGSGLLSGEGQRPLQLGPDPAARGAKCAELCIEPGRPRAAADASMSELTRGHHSDEGGCQRSPGAKPRLKGQENDTGQFVPKYPLGRRQSWLQINIKREKMQISRPRVTKQII